MTEQRDNTQRVWDLPVRATHWLLVILFGFSWWTAEYDNLEWHTWSGYGLLTLILFRVYWGFVGSSTARFGHFLRGPKAVWAYTRQLFSPTGKAVAGHNPLGGWSAIALLALLLSQVLLGLFSEGVDGLAYGPLSYKVSFDTGRWAAETHEALFNVVLAFIGLHISAVFFYWFYKKNNLITAMFTGRQRVEGNDSVYIAPWWRAIIGLVLAGGFVWWLVT